MSEAKSKISVGTSTNVYSNNLQFSSEFPATIVTIWLNVANEAIIPNQFYLYNLNLVKDGPDVPSTPISVSSQKGVPDDWSIAFFTENGALYCTEPGMGPDILNQEGPNELEVTFLPSDTYGQAQVSITLQDGNVKGPYDMYLFGQPVSVV